MADARKPTVIKDFPGRAVDAYLKTHGVLPGEPTGYQASVTVTAKTRYVIISRMPDAKALTLPGERIEEFLTDIATSPCRETLHHWFEICEEVKSRAK